MMTRLNWLLAIPGFLLALGAGTTVYLATTSARPDGERAANSLAQVVVASSEIPSGTALQGATLNRLFKVEQQPVDSLPRDFLSTLVGLEGRVVSTALKAGQPLLASQLSASASTGIGPVQGVAAVLPEGRVAVVLPVNEQLSLGGALRPADRVDLIASLSVKQPDGAQQIVTQALLRDLRVLATGSLTSAPSPGELTPRGTYTTITLAVSSGDALLVQHLLASNVRLALVLRRPDDPGGSEPLPPVTNEDVARRFGLAPAR